MIGWIEMLFCDHRYNWIKDQRVQFTKDDYKIKCKKCGHVQIIALHEIDNWLSSLGGIER